MPALSPTMTEGNIASWKVKEGEAFGAGDVLLEIETDKATMDVEAQEDGVMMKIMAQDGSKAVQVGARIAVLAEAGDDINALEIPADEPQRTTSQENAAAAKENAPTPVEQASRPPRVASGETHVQKYPLTPAVEHLVKQHNLREEDVASIKPTGPNGRLLKGDVLAYLGTIRAETPAVLSSRFEKMSHLDLSNIKVAVKKSAVVPPKKAGTAAVEAPEIEALEVNVPISLAKAVEVQNRIHDTLGIFLPLSTFIARAAEAANDHLPRSTREPTPAELFDQVLGLDKIKGGSRAAYMPQVSAIPPASVLEPLRPRTRKADIIDELAPRKKTTPRVRGVPTVPGLSNDLNLFSLVVPKEEGRRAHEFLSRCKLMLESDPGRLVL
ncbi:pyruvate dehydrogenase protein x component [Drechmeria coniospora]|uniref:Pyruvate dehydrogenase protein x component n=1 Tax=Drechmeria coniospora TaxID=98403 RepID=A0A151GSM5_DRECN|nr:pyruvate dehydrogenase protein x component [Drechmeria coniospora]KYK60119.1 pyruvate dehydrogenase protein x component [Drechmeria coniospora]